MKILYFAMSNKIILQSTIIKEKNFFVKHLFLSVNIAFFLIWAYNRSDKYNTHVMQGDIIMARKPSTENPKKEAIIASATKLFFERGFEGTSVRAIMQVASGDVGLFYYYFRGKAELFNVVLERFFDSYHEEMRAIVQKGERDPYRVLLYFFDYLKKIVVDFRETYAENMHPTVRWAIRERTLTIIVPYIREIVEILVEHGAKPKMNLDVTAMFIAHGVGSVILHEDSEWVEKVTPELRLGINLILGENSEHADIMFPYPVQIRDLDEIIAFANEAKDHFPNVNTETFREELVERINDGEILVIRNGDEVVGCIVFSKTRDEIDFLYVAPAWRRQGIADRLMVSALAQYPTDIKVFLVTAAEDTGILSEGDLAFIHRYDFEKRSEENGACRWFTRVKGDL